MKLQLIISFVVFLVLQKFHQGSAFVPNIGTSISPLGSPAYYPSLLSHRSKSGRLYQRDTTDSAEPPRNHIIVTEQGLQWANNRTNANRPASQLESLVGNAKALNPLRGALTSDQSAINAVVDAASNITTTDKETLKEKAKTLGKASISGLTVALAMVPEATAFAFVAGVNPLVGLWTTVMLGFTAATLGGRAGICSSASGACSIVVAGLSRQYGAEYLSACAMAAGLLQIVGGTLGLGKFVRLVPHPVMLGFVNGLAILMTKAQLVQFQGMNPMDGTVGTSMFGITALTMVLIKLLPKVFSFIPPTLGAVVLSTIVSQVAKLPVRTLTDVAGASTFAGGLSVLPSFCWWPANVPLSLETLKIIFPFAATMAAVGSIESLLTMQLVDGMMDDGKRGSTRKECVGQGSGNIVSGLFGGIGGCALLGQSIINVQSGGGVSRWSGMSMALFLALGIVVGAPLLGQVPVASLVGVMILVCFQTFSWSSLRLLRKVPKLDALIIALVSIVTVQRDLAQAVLVGTVSSALGFAWKQSTHLTAATNVDRDEKEYRLQGPLFFGSTQQFKTLFDCQSDPDKVILDFSNCRAYDHSALEAIHSLADAYGSLGKTVYLRHLSPDCGKLLAKMYQSGTLPPYEIVEVDLANDPDYGLAVNYAK